MLSKFGAYYFETSYIIYSLHMTLLDTHDFIIML